MNQIGIIFLIGIVLTKTSFANLPDDPKEYAEWEVSILRTIESQESLPKEESIPKLGKLLLQLSRGTNIEKNDRPVFRAAQTAILQIPDHAEYYEKKIKDGMAMVENQPDDGLYPRTFNGPRIEIFQILGQIPSPETVRVLGDMLADDRGGFEWKEGDPMPTADDVAQGTLKNSGYASIALYGLIGNPLTPYRGHFIENVDVPEWRLWYNQVKAGTRPIRFKGDPKEYSLKGLIKDGEIKGNSRPERRTVDEKAQPSQSQKESTPQRRGIIAAVVALLLVCGWWVYRRKQKA